MNPMPRPIEFNEIRPLLIYILDNTGSFEIFLKDLCLNSEVHIPTLPPTYCSMATVKREALDQAERYFNLAARGLLDVSKIVSHVPQCIFKLDCLRRRAVIKSDNVDLIEEYASRLEHVEGIAFNANII